MATLANAVNKLKEVQKSQRYGNDITLKYLWEQLWCTYIEVNSRNSENFEDVLRDLTGPQGARTSAGGADKETVRRKERTSNNGSSTMY
jgi:hypothetical protein